MGDKPTGGTLCEKKDWEWQRFKLEISRDAATRLVKSGSRIGVALVGLGRMGQIHLKNLIREPRANLIYCFDANQQVLDHLHKTMFFAEYGIKALLCDCFDVALKDPNVKAVVIATPHQYHEFFAARALKASKSVLCEKPLTLISSHVEPLFNLAKQNRVFLMCAFNRRYDPDYTYIYRQIHEENALGLIHSIRFSSRDGQTPSLSYVRVSGDIFHDSTIHDFDCTLWLLKQLPKTIQIMGKTWKEHYAASPDELAKLSDTDKRLLGEIDDFYTAQVSLKFPSGAMVIIDNSRQSCYGYDNRCELHGMRGLLKHDGKHSLNVVQHTDAVIAGSPMNYSFASRYSTAYANELKDLLTMAELAGTEFYEDRESLRRVLQEVPRPALIVAALRVADAAVEAWKKKGPVDLYWTDEFRQQFAEDMD